MFCSFIDYNYAVYCQNNTVLTSLYSNILNIEQQTYFDFYDKFISTSIHNNISATNFGLIYLYNYLLSIKDNFTSHSDLKFLNLNFEIISRNTMTELLYALKLSDDLYHYIPYNSKIDIELWSQNNQNLNLNYIKIIYNNEDVTCKSDWCIDLCNGINRLCFFEEFLTKIKDYIIYYLNNDSENPKNLCKLTDNETDLDFP